jgi:hypothetical protein
MKILPSSKFPLLILLLSGRVLCASPSTNIMPGLTYYMGAENLSGKLAFLVQHDYRVETNSATAASIYEFDLSPKKLKKVTDAPNGLFVPSRVGGTFCVIFQYGMGDAENTNIFAYSEALGLSRMTNIEGSPSGTVSINNHIFCYVDGFNIPIPGHYLITNKDQTLGKKLIDYDIGGNQMRQIQLPNASQWQSEAYDGIHAPREQTNFLHFYYHRVGDRLRDGKDYETGIYNLDIHSGNIQWFADLIIDDDDDGFTFKSFDGRYIFFEGGSGAPISGSTLVSSTLNSSKYKYQDPKGKTAKVLHRFSLLSTGSYELLQLSPDRHYALLSVIKGITTRKFSEWPGSTTTYYLLDVSTGEMRVLLEDRSMATTSSSVSKVWWIQ